MKWLKIGGVVFGAMAITALGIDAADTLQGSRSTLLGQLAATENGGCPDGMLTVPSATTFSCVDMYEASPASECPSPDPTNELESMQNIEDSSCSAVSREGALPWRIVSRESAQLACVRSGRRLPTNEEWQLFAAGTPDSASDCNVSEKSVHKTGAHRTCESAVGVYDAVGNVWEWTHDDVFDGTYNGRALPAEGYVVQVDRGGVATQSGATSSDLFGKDYFWSEQEGAYAIMRGGFYSSREDAGVYTVHAATLPTMTGAAIGFRCVL